MEAHTTQPEHAAIPASKQNQDGRGQEGGICVDTIPSPASPTAERQRLQQQQQHSSEQQPGLFFKSKSQPANFSVSAASPGSAIAADTGDVIPVYVTDVHSRPKSDSCLLPGPSVTSSSSPPLLPPPLPPPPPPSFLIAAAAPLLPQQLSQKPEAGSRRRGLRMSHEQREAAKRQLVNGLKKFTMFLVSHVGLTCLVVVYSIMGGFIFKAIEGPTEANKRTSTVGIRKKLLTNLWDMTNNLNIFHPEKWKTLAEDQIEEFQKDLYSVLKESDGHSPDFVETNPQWTYAGSLLYSVTIITTIGYGNLTPKTVLGRVVTMLYAVIGIPMTLLCLANIGSFMASCFRLLWKQIVCRPCRDHIRRRSRFRAAQKKATTALYVANLVKQKRDLAAHAVAGGGGGSGGVCGGGGGGGSEGGGTGRSYDAGMSDSPAAIHDSTILLLGKHGGACDSPARSSTGVGSERGVSGLDGTAANTAGSVSVSVSSELHHDVSSDHLQAIALLPECSTATVITTSTGDFNPNLEHSSSFLSAPPSRLRSGSRDEVRAFPEACPDPDVPKDLDLQAVTLALPTSPTSFASHVSGNPGPVIVAAAAVTTTTTAAAEGEPYEATPPPARKRQSEVVRVPIMVCLVLVVAYMVLGAVLFSVWEHWSYFDSFYFCFVTLSTIGFGDMVPGYGLDKWGNQAKRVSCTLYLLFGLALLAMCFELIQFECRQMFITLASAMGFTIENKDAVEEKKNKDKPSATVAVAAVTAL